MKFDDLEPTTHYDRVTPAWILLLGEDLHYGLFREGSESLGVATRNLTGLMAEYAAIEAGMHVLDVGCGTGNPACWLANALACKVTGISTSEVGVANAQQRAARENLTHLVDFRPADGMDNGFPDNSFDRVWALESSHLMPRRDRLLSECERVLRPGGRLVLCDIVLCSPMPISEVMKNRDPLLLLQDVFGRARMELLSTYESLAEKVGLVIEKSRDITAMTRPTFSRWRTNAHEHRDGVIAQIGEKSWRQFVEACDVLERFWDDGKLGYGILSASKPSGIPLNSEADG